MWFVTFTTSVKASTLSNFTSRYQSITKRLTYPHTYQTYTLLSSVFYNSLWLVTFRISAKAFGLPKFTLRYQRIAKFWTHARTYKVYTFFEKVHCALWRAGSTDIPDPLSLHVSLSFIAFGRSSGLHPVSSHSCCMNVRAGRPAFDWP